jgi:hypothetical protein
MLSPVEGAASRVDQLHALPERIVAEHGVPTAASGSYAPDAPAPTAEERPQDEPTAEPDRRNEKPAGAALAAAEGSPIQSALAELRTTGPAPRAILRAESAQFVPGPASNQRLEPGTYTIRAADLNKHITQILDQVDAELRVTRTIAGTAAIATAACSVGYVVWTVQSGVLAASYLSGLSVLRSMDPLPILEFWEAKRARIRRRRPDADPDDDDEDIRSLLA